MAAMPGTAEQFRPYYDIMFAPNNKAGLTARQPDGVMRRRGRGDADRARPRGLNGTGRRTNPMIVSTTANISVGISTSRSTPRDDYRLPVAAERHLPDVAVRGCPGSRDGGVRPARAYRSKAR